MDFVDLHEDIAFSSFYSEVIHKTEQSNIDLLKNFNSIIFSVVFPHISINYDNVKTVPEFSVMIEQFKFYKYLEKNFNTNIIKKYDDINNGLNFLISMEGTDVMNNPDDIYILHDLGLRNLGFTWNYDTKFASSCHSKKDYGLTGYGEELIDLCNKNNIIIDLAHASRNTILEACNLSSKPVIDSHTNFKSIKDNIRNIDDKEIESIIDTNGVIGITAITDTLKTPDIKGIIESIYYLGDNYGWKYVSMGTDFLGINKTPDGFENIKKMESLRNVLGDHANDVLYKNALRVIKENLK